MTYHLDVAIGSEGAWITNHHRNARIRLDSETTLSGLNAWLHHPSAFEQTYYVEDTYNSRREISYSHVTGLLTLHHPAPGSDRTFDPNSEESLARLVRTLKRLATDMDPGDYQPSLDLPVPTPEQLAARTIYTEVATPRGLSAYKPKTLSGPAAFEAMTAALQQTRFASPAPTPGGP